MLPTQFEILGLTLHTYGFLIGIGALLAYWCIEKAADRHAVARTCLDSLAVWVLAFGLIGARVWHVITDFWLYTDNPVATLFIWEGGLSIIGGLLGGALGIVVASHRSHCSKHPVSKLADLLPFGVPVAQAVGRTGNWVNQELYGTPTALPWGIPISPEHRPELLAESARFHPLFAYEAVPLLCFAGLVWWYDRKNPRLFGRGVYAAGYLLFYSLLRFFLEFLRVEKTLFFETFLSVNQVVLVGVACVCVVWLVQKGWR